ncbi:transglutaminase [Paenibacillus sp. 32O-W]|uniref:transglutaminase domain-containing protein n=1 Tax=Paenibacillus sp. 32O-W TaxID=1695218 RepID=UPI00071FDF74|nr:transglutaminase domain-containing protein [Paenibacillus sp. 32O-W]ALS29773.1 transglutaminase [Paenibacillus sp. 32O-W]
MRKPYWILFMAAALLVFGFGRYDGWRDALAAAGMPEADAAAAPLTPERLEAELAARLPERPDELKLPYAGDPKQLSARLPQLIRGALDGHDDIAYILDKFYYTIRTRDGVSVIDISLKYRETKAQSAEVERQAAAALQSLIAPQMNDHEKVKAIHDWIVRRLAYDESLRHYTAYEALDSGLAVCQGYALLAYKMLTMAGIEAKIAEGAVDTGEHVWNMVRLDGRWYHLDVTWDDPLPDRGDAVSYRYYLLTDAEMRRDHRWERSYPEAPAEYREALADLAAQGGEAGERFAALEREIGLIWLKPEHTASSAAELRDRIAAAMREGGESLRIRYADGGAATRDLKAAFAGLDGYRSYRAKFEPYRSDGSVLVDISWELQ